jgi:hypothetical protein
MKTPHGAIAMIVTLGAAVAAQTPDPTARPKFEVATIKRNVTVDSGGRGGIAASGTFRLVNVDVQMMILIAYRAGRQLFPSQIIGAPS